MQPPRVNHSHLTTPTLQERTVHSQSELMNTTPTASAARLYQKVVPPLSILQLGDSEKGEGESNSTGTAVTNVSAGMPDVYNKLIACAER
jgi:hypothetical protein